MINLQVQGYMIIGSNILQSMLNEVGRCTSCVGGGGGGLQITENVSKRIGMCENLVLFCINCKNSRKGKEKGDDGH